MSALFLCGHVLDELKSWPDQFFHCVVTSPPYFGLRDYKTEAQVWNGGWRGHLGGEPTPELYVEHLVSIFREVRRTLRDDGLLWLVIGDSYAGSWGNQGRKPERGSQRPINGPMMQNLEPYPKAEHNTGSWVKDHPTLKPKDLCMIPARVALALQADGWWLRQDIIWEKRNPLPESVRDRCTKSHEYIFMLSKSARYFFNADAIAEPLATNPKENYLARAKIFGRGQQGAADARGNDRDKSGGFPPSYRGSSFTAGKTAATKPESGHGSVGQGPRYDHPTRNKRDVWTIATRSFKGAHFATFPPELVCTCLLAGCPPGGTVLDPFSGAGTTSLVAEELGLDSVGIELNPLYVEMAENRIRGAK
jgi:DNA modification methylase